MSKRLITLRQIQAEKLPRSRSWLFAEMKSGKFPRPLDMNGCGPNLWREEDIDIYLAEFIAAAEKRASESNGAERRSMDAHALVARRRSRAGANDAAA